MRTGLVVEGYQIFSAIITPIQILILIASLIIFSVLWFIVDKTKTGKAIRAVADDPVGASVSGIYPEKVILYAFGIGSALTGMASVLISLLGGFFLGIVENLGIWKIQAGWKDTQ